MSIEKMLCLSTAHITEEDSKLLAERAGLLAETDDPNYNQIGSWVDWLYPYEHRDYGWLICVSSATDDHTVRAHLPNHMLAILDKAEAEGCEWVLIDQDAEQYDDLPTFDW